LPPTYSGGNSFDFLGFTHYCTESKNGYKYIARKMSKTKYNASLLRCKEWMKYNRILPTKEFMKKKVVKIIGHYNYYYYAVTVNSRMIGNFIDECRT